MQKILGDPEQVDGGTIAFWRYPNGGTVTFFIGKADENRLLNSFEILEKKFSRELNYKILSEEEIKKEVKEKDPFILSLLSDKKVFLKGGEYELREVSKGKPDKKGSS